jgi:hypothetical protein
VRRTSLGRAMAEPRMRLCPRREPGSSVRFGGGQAALSQRGREHDPKCCLSPAAPALRRSCISRPLRSLSVSSMRPAILRVSDVAKGVLERYPPIKPIGKNTACGSSEQCKAATSCRREPSITCSKPSPQVKLPVVRCPVYPSRTTFVPSSR